MKDNRTLILFKARGRIRKTVGNLLKVFCLALSFQALADCPGINLRPGEKLNMQFQFASPPTTALGPIDFLYFEVGMSLSDWHEGSYLDIRLYDGRNLLSASSLLSFGSYRSERSLWPGTTIEFKTLVNGSICGEYEIVPFFVRPTIFSSVFMSAPYPKTGFAVSGGFYQGQTATIISCRVVAAEEILVGNFEGGEAGTCGKNLIRP